MGQQLSGFFSSENAFGQREITLDSETKTHCERDSRRSDGASSKGPILLTNG